MFGTYGHTDTSLLGMLGVRTTHTRARTHTAGPLYVSVASEVHVLIQLLKPFSGFRSAQKPAHAAQQHHTRHREVRRQNVQVQVV